MKYVMASDWHGYWDKVPGNSSSFTMSMLVPPMAPAFFRGGTATTFLLFDKRTRAPRRAWTGKVFDIEHNPPSPRIGFRVKIAREIRFPARYAGFVDGWYVENPEPSPDSYGLW